MKRQPTLMLLEMTIKLLAGEIPGNSAVQMLLIWFKRVISESEHSSVCCERTAKRSPAARRISFHRLGCVGHPCAYVNQPAHSDDILLSA